jgi:transposase
MRTAYKCRAYPDPEQAHVLNRTSGCVRVAWNQTLAWRRQRYQDGKTGTTYAQASACLTAMKTTDELAWLNAVSSVPLQQAIRHQQAAYAAFFAGRARYPRFKSRDGRQCAAYTRSGFRWRDGALHLNRRLAKAIRYLLAELSLGTRAWPCPSCGTRHDRDVNAATNILAAGRAVAGGNPGDACGADVSHSGSSRVRSAVKQEPRPVRAGIPVHQGGE